MSKRITIVEIAKEAGVSLPTVSRVLNNRPDVSPETRERVQSIVNRHGFQPSAIARSLDARRTHTIALATLHFEKRGLLSDPYFAGVVSGIVDTLTPLGIFVMFFPVMEGEKAAAAFRSFLQSGRVDGLILHNAQIDDPLLAVIRETMTPCVALEHDKPVHELSVNVTVDWSGISLLVDHLVRKGHSKIGFIHGNLYEPGGLIGLQMYRKALHEHGLTIREEWVQGGKWYEEGGVEGMQRILSASERPTAVVAATDLVAIGAIDVIRSAGLRVPEDIAVTGYNDDPYAKHLTPALTTLHYDFGEVGSVAAKCLMALIDSKSAERTNVTIPVKLMVRDSA